jgi:gluconolactonase
MRAALKLALVAAALLWYRLAVADLPAGTPAASIDLATQAGVAQVSGEWRYSDARIVDIQFPAADANGQPTGAPGAAQDISPRAGGRDFDDSAWQRIAPETLSARRCAGRACFNWYRIRLTVPARIGDFETAGSTAVFSTSLDDYAEVWVDGELPRAAGQSGGSVVAGWNAENRLAVGRRLDPGQQIQLAVFGMNGPVSDAPTNYIWMRLARLDFYAGSNAPVAVPPQEVNVAVERLDPAIGAIVPANAKVFKLAEGFDFIEGPVWLPEGALLFSDPNRNRIYRYDERTGTLAVFRENSGYDGADIGEYGQPGSNGLALDARGRLTIDEHGRRRVTRLETDGTLTVLADRYQGQRLNSPNDLVYRSDGALYFTDPPFGLPKFFDDPRKELPWSGVFLVRNGRVELLANELAGPNGLAFSPDEKFLYVGNWDPQRKVVMRYPVRRDGRLGRGEVFFDMTGAPGEEALDGLKVDSAGNLYVSGPGGVWILSASGRHLGTIRAPRLPANFAWGGADGRTLYMTARSTLYRMPLLVAGAGRGREARP